MGLSRGDCRLIIMVCTYSSLAMKKVVREETHSEDRATLLVGLVRRVCRLFPGSPIKKSAGPSPSLQWSIHACTFLNLMEELYYLTLKWLSSLAVL